MKTKSWLAALLGVSTALIVSLAASSSAAAGTTERAHWTLDETSGNVAHDSSGSGNHGIAYNTRGDGQAYAFNGVSSKVVVPGSSSLNPGSASFSYGVTLTMPAPPTAKETFDVLRKGVVKSVGGNYKVEIKTTRTGRAVARCVVKDAAKQVAAIASQSTVAGDLADGDTHVVTCTKARTGVSVKVDGLATRTKTVSALGSVSNTAALGLGAKAELAPTTGFDWFAGKLYDAWVAVK